MSNVKQSPPISPVMIICATILLVCMLGGITFNLALGRDPGVLINFCGLLVAQAGGAAAILYRVERVGNTVEELANGTGKANTKTAVREALSEHVDETLAQEKIEHG